MSLSRLASWLARRVLRAELSDAMSGFFMMRRDCLEVVAPDLSTSGFKVLADIIASADTLRITEIGYNFRERIAGESKMDFGIGLDFLGLMLNKSTGGFIPVRFILFIITGLSGLAVHLTTLYLWLNLVPSASFWWAQAVASLTAMTSNFFVNNLVTFRDQKLKGAELLRGLGLFYLVCGLGAVTNVGLASMVFEINHVWWFAGIVGAVMSALWNYSLSTFFIWGRK